ncbi:hypothetical protein RhiXN_05132 [Rhizoctonia solani]|uniref:Uncharacterized protein n=1 Tax=Rhizoctonia solani TaxID=456999 RepID=A0A8H8NR87_9AGAM|nr:uncharacterized protein RhiXN_05132 [Rhizoctonia solani]QRW17130.1 hypothetical protein RhiXN_05132 [Rhizoctonia solani]
MPVPHGSPESYAGSLPFMTPRTPISPDDTRSVLGTGGFPHVKSRLDTTRGDKAKQSGAFRRTGNVFNHPLEDKDQLKGLLKLGQTHGQTSLGSLESIRSFSRSGDTPPTIPDYTTIAREKTKIHYEGVHRAAVLLAEKQRANTYVDLLRVDEPPATSNAKSKGHPMKELVSHARHQFDVIERVDHSFIKTCAGIIGRKKEAERFAQAEARKQDQIPTSYAAWKKLSEARQVKVARFLQTADEHKDSILVANNWNREDAMRLHQEYLDQPEFKDEVSTLLARRITTDPRKRPTTTQTPNPHAQ